MGIEGTFQVQCVRNLINEAKFHATCDDRGYRTGRFDWQRFRATIEREGRENCNGCRNCHYVADIYMQDFMFDGWWQGVKEALVAYANIPDREEVPV